MLVLEFRCRSHYWQLGRLKATEFSSSFFLFCSLCLICLQWATFFFFIPSSICVAASFIYWWYKITSVFFSKFLVKRNLNEELYSLCYYLKGKVCYFIMWQILDCFRAFYEYKLLPNRIQSSFLSKLFTSG